MIILLGGYSVLTVGDGGTSSKTMGKVEPRGQPSYTDAGVVVN